MTSSRMTSRSYPRITPNLSRGLAFGVIIIIALIAFEIFNYSTTHFALSDLLGDLRFAGISWATILAIAFCGIDFAGIARLFTPEGSTGENKETWYLFGAWLLAATMNAMLTWWGVSLALLERQSAGVAIIERDILLRAVPIFVAILVWLIRVLMIGTFSMAGNHLFDAQSDQRKDQAAAYQASSQPVSASRSYGKAHNNSAQVAQSSSRANSYPRTSKQPAVYPDEDSGYARPEPSYQPLAAASNRSQVIGESSVATSRSFGSTRRSN